MTNTASKHGLRATAEAKRKKHSQRTPLPPKAGVIEDAKAAIAEAKQSFRVEPLTKKGRLIPAQASEVVAAAKKGKKAKADKGPKKASSSNAKASNPTVPPKGLGAKASAFYADAVAAGWLVNSESLSGHDKLDVHRGDEQITIEWRSEVFQDSCSYLRPDGSTIKLRNASAARKQMAAAAPSEEELSRLANARQRVGKSAGPRVIKRSMPFDPETLTDEELAEVVKGSKLVWINSISNQEESDGVAGSAEVRVTEERSGRTIHFNSPVGARSVRVSSLIHCTGSRSLQALRKNRRA